MSQMTAEEIARGLMAAGVPSDRAQAEALRQTGKGPGFVPALKIHRDAEVPVVEELPEIVWPLRLSLPWSHLISDNCRYASGTERTGGGLLLTSDYRRCRGLIRDRVRDTLGHPQPAPAAIPVSVEASVWVPDNRPHDCTNFAKVCHDAMEKVVYTNDRWIYSAHWYRAGVDVDAPRAELLITRLPIAA